MAYSDESAGIVARLRAQLELISDEQTRKLTAAWVRAWDDVAPDLLAALDELAGSDKPLTRAQLLRSRRLVNALSLVEARLAGLMGLAAADSIAQLRTIIDSAGHTTDHLISSMLPPGESVNGWTRVDPLQADAIVTRAEKQITQRSFPISAEATATIRRELVRTMLVGDNPREAARRMVAKTEGIFNGGLSRALTIARTEQLDAHRAAAQAAENENADVIAGWTWVAALSERTCQACWSKHGSEHPTSEAGPDGHQNCRCARVPRTKTWKELGFDIDEPANILPDAEAQFDRLSTSQQLEVLGPARFAAWRAGKYPMSSWATKRTNDGWRDSWVPSKAPAGFKGARRPDLATGGSGAGAGLPRATTFGDGWGPEPDPTDGAATRAYWLRRQQALPVDFKSDQPEPHEVRFVERFLNAGHTLDWIAKERFTPTNDFVWTSNSNLPVELKSVYSGKYSSIRGRVLDAASRAERHGVSKSNFIIDIGDQDLTDSLREELGGYNVGRRKYRITHLWVMARGDLIPIHLRA